MMETKPAFRSLRIVGRTASARTSATRLLASSLLIPRSDMSRSRRVSIRAAEVRCHRPPTAPGIPLRFNSFASARWETKPAAISFRMVGSKARARASAARLPPNAPCLPRLLGDVSPRTRSIGPSWPGFDTAADVKIVSKPHLSRTHLVAGYSSPLSAIKANKRRPAQELGPGRAINLPVHPRSGRSEHNSGEKRAPVA